MHIEVLSLRFRLNGIGWLTIAKFLRIRKYRASSPPTQIPQSIERRLIWQQRSNFKHKSRTIWLPISGAIKKMHGMSFTLVTCDVPSFVFPTGGVPNCAPLWFFYAQNAISLRYTVLRRIFTLSSIITPTPILFSSQCDINRAVVYNNNM